MNLRLTNHFILLEHSIRHFSIKVTLWLLDNISFSKAELTTLLQISRDYKNFYALHLLLEKIPA